MSELERSGYRSPEVSRIESRVGHATRGLSSRLSALEGGGLSGARVLSGLSLTTTVQQIEHGLGRAWTAAILCGVPAGSAASVLYVQSTPNDAHWIGLALDAAETVTVVVF